MTSSSVRLHAYLAQCGVASRRASEKLIAVGRVVVNGKAVRKQGVCIDPTKDKVLVDGHPVLIETVREQYFLFNKPKGVVTTLKDPHAVRVVLDYFTDIKERLFPVGRLDKNSTGLLLMTNDGELANRLTHPRYGVEKRYQVKVRGFLDEKQINRLERGVIIEGKKTAPAQVRVIHAGREAMDLEMILCEGRKREIREMMLAVGSKVTKLKRVQFGPLMLGRLCAGERRRLTEAEIKKLKKAVGIKKK